MTDSFQSEISASSDSDEEVAQIPIARPVRSTNSASSDSDEEVAQRPEFEILEPIAQPVRSPSSLRRQDTETIPIATNSNTDNINTDKVMELKLPTLTSLVKEEFGINLHRLHMLFSRINHDPNLIQAGKNIIDAGKNIVKAGKTILEEHNATINDTYTFAQGVLMNKLLAPLAMMGANPPKQDNQAVFERVHDQWIHAATKRQ